MTINNLYSEDKINTLLQDCCGALHNWAFQDENSLGRRRQLDRDRIMFAYMNPFALDTWKIKNSKAYRRLKDKTQVLAHARNSHIRTRADHTNETVENAKMMATVLGLNVGLVEAIATGHDIGHTPFGHIGEVVLSHLGGKELKHEKHGVFVAQYIERKGKGLNLTYETLLGIAMHSRGGGALRQDEKIINEIALVMYADKLSYLFSDYNDVRRHGLLPHDFKYRPIEELGSNQTERVQMVMAAIIEESARKGRVVFSEGEVYERFEDARKFMWQNVYGRIDWDSHANQLRDIYGIVEKAYKEEPHIDPTVLVSLMTDGDVEELMMSRARLDRIDETVLGKTSVGELMPSLYNREYEYWNLDLEWGHDKEQGKRRGLETCMDTV